MCIRDSYLILVLLVILLFWGILVVYNLKKKFAGDPQISSEMALAKKIVLAKICPHIFCFLSGICFGDQLKQLWGAKLHYSYIQSTVFLYYTTPTIFTIVFCYKPALW